MGNLSPRLHQHRGPEELVVDPGHLEGGQRGQGRPAQGQGDAEELGGDAGPVDPGRLVHLVRQGLHVVAEHEGAEAGLEGDVDQDQPPEAVQQLARVAHPQRQRDLAVEPEQRDQQRLLGQQVGRGEQPEQDQVEPEAEAGHHEGHAGGEEQRQQHGGHGDEQRVEEVAGEVALLPGVRVVLEGEPAERDVAVLRGVGVVAEGVEQRPQHREQPDQGGRRSGRRSSRTRAGVQAPPPWSWRRSLGGGPRG